MLNDKAKAKESKEGAKTSGGKGPTAGRKGFNPFGGGGKGAAAQAELAARLAARGKREV